MKKILANHICYKVIKGKEVTKTFKGTLFFDDNCLSFRSRTKDVFNLWPEDVSFLYSDIVEVQEKNFGIIKTGIVIITKNNVHTFAVNHRDLILDYIKGKMNKQEG